jgi:hypothetical protein
MEEKRIRNFKEALYGANIVHVPIKSNFLLLTDEVLHPFYIFQIARHASSRFELTA